MHEFYLCLENIVNIQPSENIVDEAFNKESAFHYDLFIQIGLDGLSFAILDSSRDKFIALQSYYFHTVQQESELFDKVRDILSGHTELFPGKFRRQILCIVHPKSMLIPKALYDAESLRELFQLNHSLQEGEDLISDQLQLTDAVNVFSLSSEWKDFLYENFPHSRVYHFSTSIIEGVLNRYKNSEEKILFIHIQLSQFEIIVTEGKKLIFYNSFKHFSSEDYMYYLLFVCEQLHLNPETIKVVLLGTIEKNSAIYLITKKYIRNVEWMERPDSFLFSYKFDDIAAHFHFGLFNQHLCG